MNSLYTRETLQGIFKQKKPNLAKSSYTTYVNTILRIQNALGQPTEKELEDWLDGMKPTAARNNMTPLMILYGEQRHRRLFDKYNAQAESQLDQQRLSPSEMKHWVSGKSIRRMLQRLKEDCETHKVFSGRSTEAKWRLRQMYVLWSVHFEFPWRNLLHNCHVVYKKSDVDDKHNYYCVPEHAFFISDFKTRRVFLRHKYELPLKHRVSPKLAQLLKKHVAGREGEPLFCNMRGAKLSKNGYSNLLTGATKKYLAKRVGSSLWRHIWLTEWSRNTKTLKQRREAAFRMHQVSLVTQMRYERPEVAME